MLVECSIGEYSENMKWENEGVIRLQGMSNHMILQRIWDIPVDVIISQNGCSCYIVDFQRH